MITQTLARLAKLEALLLALTARQHDPRGLPYRVVYLADGEEPPPARGHEPQLTLYVHRIGKFIFPIPAAPVTQG